VTDPEPTGLPGLRGLAGPAEPATRAATRSVNAVLRTARAPRTLRTRLTAVVSVIATVAIVATLVAIAYGLPRLLQNALEAEQRTRVDRIEQSLLSNGKLPDNETFAQVVAPTALGANIIDKTQSFDGASLLSATQLELALSGQNVTINTQVEALDGSARLFARATVIGGRPVVIVVGSSLQQLDRTRRLLIATMLAGGFLLSLLTAAGAWLLSGAALRPVQRMTDEAASLANATEAGGVHGLRKRLDIPTSRDEIAYLGETFNGLLDRVEESVRRERSFVDDASHELRTPLAILRGELELAAAHPGDADEQRSLVTRLAREVDRLANLADDLLVLARVGAAEIPTYTTVELLSVAARVVGRLGSAAPRVRIEVSGDRGTVAWRSDHAERVLNNLVANAVRHARERIAVTVEQTESGVCLLVADDGPGFSDEFLPHAFERFATADRARTRRHTTGGTGLGLAIVRELVEARGGTVSAANGPQTWDPRGNGAKVTVTIPIIDAE
jgi:two-component system, OmpR family, sensor kinase